jgi:hypothetical protein
MMWCCLLVCFLVLACGALALCPDSRFTKRGSTRTFASSATVFVSAASIVDVFVRADESLPAASVAVDVLTLDGAALDVTIVSSTDAAASPTATTTTTTTLQQRPASPVPSGVSPQQTTSMTVLTSAAPIDPATKSVDVTSSPAATPSLSVFFASPEDQVSPASSLQMPWASLAAVCGSLLFQPAAAQDDCAVLPKIRVVFRVGVAPSPGPAPTGTSVSPCAEQTANGLRFGDCTSSCATGRHLSSSRNMVWGCNGYAADVKCCLGSRRPISESVFLSEALRVRPGSGACFRSGDRRLARAASLAACGAAKAAFRVVGAGDTMLHTTEPSTVPAPEAQGRTLVDPSLTPVFRSADFAWVNAEGPFCDIVGAPNKCGSSSSSSCFAFKTPPSYFKTVLKDQLDLEAVSLANNHMGDFGAQCRAQSEQVAAQNGVLQSGRAGTIAHDDVRKIAFIAFHSQSESNDSTDIPGVKALVAQAKPGYRVVISCHCGGEGSGAQTLPRGPEVYLGANRGDCRLFARSAIDSGADVVMMHGPHVLRGAELYKGRIVFYSLGNFATWQRFNLDGLAGTGAVAVVDIDDDGAFVSGTVVSTKQSDAIEAGSFGALLDAGNAAAEQIAELSESDFDTRTLDITQSGFVLPV